MLMKINVIWIFKYLALRPVQINGVARDVFGEKSHQGGQRPAAICRRFNLVPGYTGHTLIHITHLIYIYISQKHPRIHPAYNPNVHWLHKILGVNRLIKGPKLLLQVYHWCIHRCIWGVCGVYPGCIQCIWGVPSVPQGHPVYTQPLKYFFSLQNLYLCANCLTQSEGKRGRIWTNKYKLPNHLPPTKIELGT